jgi:hypothetical protein
MTRRTRRRLLLALAVGMAGIAVGVALWLTRSPVNHDNYDRIKAGMSLAEAKALLGEPTQEVPVWTASDRPGVRQLAETRRLWEGGDVIITLTFDPHDIVFATKLDEPPTSSLDRLRRWLRL